MIEGTRRRDVITGTKNDEIIIGGLRGDILTGDGGRDRFVYRQVGDRVDTIKDFAVSEEQLVFTDLLASVGYQGSDPIAEGYVQFGSRQGNALVLFDRNGFDIPGGARPLILLEDVTVAEISNPDNFIFI